MEELRCLGNLGPGLLVSGVGSVAEDLRLRDGSCNLAMIQVRGEGRETGISQPCADCLDCVVQSLPGMQYQYTGSPACRREGEKTIRLRM